MPSAHQAVLDCGGSLRAYVTKAHRPNWYSVGDRVGFTDRNPGYIIDAAIAKKADELTRYKAAAGSDIRLLLVADRLQNSGKVTAAHGFAFDFRGFQAVYFFLYPEDVVILDALPDSAN